MLHDLQYNKLQLRLLERAQNNCHADMRMNFLNRDINETVQYWAAQTLHAAIKVKQQQN